MHSSVFSNDLSHFSTHLTNETRSTLFCRVSRIVREDSKQITIVNIGPLEVVTLALATVVFAQFYLHCGQRLDFSARPVSRFCAGEIGHQLVDVFELAQCGPAAISASPLRARSQPHGKRFGEVFGRVRLCVPRRQVQHVFPALRFRLVEVRIRLRERAEELPVLAFEVKPESGVERVAGFVPKDSQALGVRSAFNFEHLLAFELHQARMSEVKRNRDAGHAVWRKPLFRQPNMRFEPNSAGIELAVKPFYMRFEERPFYFYGQVADA